MVHLVLSSTKGNQGQRYFPHTGYLGLTPIRVEGIVRTKLDTDGKRLPAKSISIAVRCYESRIGRVNALQSNLLVDLTHTLWSKPDDVEYDPIGNLEFPFRLSIPARVAGFSTAVFVDYRCVWRIEAVLHHAPIVGLGSRQVRHFELPLVRYDLPPPPRSISPPCHLETTKPRAPRIRYTINSPKNPIGPQDLVSIPIHLHPLDPGVSIRSASVIVERRIILHDIDPAFPKPAFSYSPTSDYQELASEPASSSSTLSLAPPTITPNSIFPSTSTPSLASESAPLIPPSLPTSSSAKVIANPIAGVESSGSFARDARGMWSKTLTLQWPAPKSHSRWAIGETITSDLVSVKYFIRTKIIVTSPTGTESLELEDQELRVVSTNEAERQLALAKYTEALEAEAPAASSSSSSRSKSKSPKRSRPADDTARPPLPRGTVIAPSPWALPVAHSRPIQKARRPHTSAGPRDRPVDFAGAAYALPAGPSGGGHRGAGAALDGAAKAKGKATRPDTAGAAPSASLVGGRSSASFWSTVHSNGVQPPPPPRAGGLSSASTSTSGSVSSASATASVSAGASRKSSKSGKSSSSRTPGAADPAAQMREWEEELKRIEVRSRRSSDLLGFAGKMKRVVGIGRGPVPVPVPPVAVDM